MFQKVERGGQLLVVLLVRRDIGLRTRGVLDAVRQMALERRLALHVFLALEIVGHVLEHLVIGLDALGLDRPSGGRVVARRRQAERAVLAERHDRLNRALAERPGADQRGALVILQRARDDLRRRGRTAVDQHHERLAAGEVAARPRVDSLGFVRRPAAGRHDLALVDEGIDDVDRLVEQAARVVAQIKDVALELVRRDFRMEFVHRRLQAVGRLLGELGDADVADVAVLDMGANRLDPNQVANEGEVLDLLLRAANDLELDGRVD